MTLYEAWNIAWKDMYHGFKKEDLASTKEFIGFCIKPTDNLTRGRKYRMKMLGFGLLGDGDDSFCRVIGDNGNSHFYRITRFVKVKNMIRYKRVSH